jgi:hypothetical protein
MIAEHKISRILTREFQARIGVGVIVLFDAYYLCYGVVQACRDQRLPFVSTLTHHRSLFKAG